MAAIAEQAYVLHSIAWRETSLVLELFTRDHGRVAVMAKGARRPRSTLRAVLLQFQPIELAFSGRNELKTLVRAEWRGGVPLPQGDSLLIAFYLNELLVRLLPREDPHPRLFDGYEATLKALGEVAEGVSRDRAPGDRMPTDRLAEKRVAEDRVAEEGVAEEGVDEDRVAEDRVAEDRIAEDRVAARERILRRFEWLLLQEIGYAPDLARDRDGLPIDEAGYYRIVGGQWLAVEEPPPQASRADVYTGSALRGMASGRYDGPGVLGQAKRLSRQVLAEHLDGATLYTRRILIDLHRME